MFEAYSIGVRISLINHASAGLAALSQAFLRTHSDAEKLEARIKSIQGMMLKGGLIAAGGAAILGAFKAPLDAAKEFQRESAKFSLFGMGEKVNAEARRFAEGMNIVGTSSTEAMRALTEAQGVFRESGLDGFKALDGAKLAAPILSKIAFANAALDDESKQRMHAQSLSMLRFIELRGGLKDAPTFNAIADAGWKAIRSSGGNVDWEQLRQFMARGGVAAQGLSNTALFGKLEPVIGELKGSTAGNAWMTAYNRLVGGVRVPNQIAHLLAENGIWDASKIEWNSMGGIKRINGNPLKDMATFASDPVEFYEKSILPMYAKLGIDSLTDRSRENTMIFGRTGGAMFSLIDRQLATIHHSVEAQSKALGIDASVAEAKGTLPGQEVDFHAKFSTLMQKLGEKILPMACSALEMLIPLVESASKWIDRHGTATKWLAGSFVALGAAMAIGGTVMVLAGGFRGLGLVLTGIGNLSGLTTGLSGVAGGLSAITMAAGAFMAFYAGWKAGGLLNDAMNSATQKATGDKNDTWLQALSDKFMPFNPKTGKREFSMNSAIWGTGESVKANRELEANYHRLYDLGSKRYLSADEAMAKDRQSKSDLAKDMDSVLKFGSPYISRGSSQAAQTQGDVYLDGRKVGKVLAPHLAGQMSGPQRGTSGFDPTQMPTPIGVGGM